MDKRNLIEQLKQGDLASFNIVFRDFQPLVFNFSRRLTHNTDDAKELVQEVFVTVWEKRETINPELNFEQFLYTIARNKVYNRSRRRVYEHAYREYLSMLAAHANETENKVRFNELVNVLERAFEQLPPVRKKVFLLSRVKGMSNEAIAHQMQTSTSNIKNHINKALRLIRRQIQINELFVLILAAIFK